MDAKEILSDFKRQMQEDKAQLEQLDILIKVAEDMGENVTTQKRTQTELKARIAKFEAALKKNGV